MNPFATLARQKVNKSLPIPFYYQIAQILREWIEDMVSGSDGDEEIPLPSENELCEIFDVNRGTVRHSLEVLEREGLVYREKGRGTFVRRRRVELDLTRLCSTTEDLKKRGWVPGTEVLSISAELPRPRIQTILNLMQDQKVWNLYRLRLADGEPLCLQRSLLPVILTEGLPDHDLTSSLYYTLINQYGLHPTEAEQTIRARAANWEEAQLLAIEEGDPVFEIFRTTYDQQNRPIEYLNSISRGDRYDFQVHLQS